MGSKNLIESSGVANIVGPNFISIPITTDVQNGKYISTDGGYIQDSMYFRVTIPYSVVGATKVNFKGYASSTYYPVAFYDVLGKFISGSTVPGSSAIVEEEISIPSNAVWVIFCTSNSNLSYFDSSIKYDEYGVNRRLDILENQAEFVEQSFDKDSSAKTYGELFSGSFLGISAYSVALLVPLYGNVNNVKVSCNSGATITVYKYNRILSTLIQIGTATATEDGDLTVSCNGATINGEFIAVKTTDKLVYRNGITNLFGTIRTNGSYRSDSSLDFSLKVELISQTYTVSTLGELNKSNNLPINSNAVTDIKSATKVNWEKGTMTSVGTVYPDASVRHSEYLKADSFFDRQVVRFESSIYAWYFFDERFYPISGYKPNTIENVTLNGQLPNIPEQAAYVVLNQKISSFVDIYAFPLDNIKSRWAGKNVLIIGDSFVDQNNLPQQIQNLLGCNIINRGISGSIVASKGGQSYQSLVDRIDGYNDDENENEKYHSYPTLCDAVIINCSTNDYGTDTPLGTMEAGYSVKTTFYGGVHYVINKLIEKYGNVPIIWINATHRYTSNKPEFVINSDGTFTITKNNVGHSLKDYVDALEEVCGVYSVPIVDVYRKSRIQPLFSSNLTAYTIDGLHPNAAGAKLIALRVLESIKYIGY